MSLNRTMLIGRLGADPELRYTQNQNPVASFSLATTEKRDDKEFTEWHKIVVWAKTAENCAKYLHKGSQVFVDGRNQTRNYDKDGVKHYVTEVVANRVMFLDSKSKSEEENAAVPSYSQEGF